MAEETKTPVYKVAKAAAKSSAKAANGFIGTGRRKTSTARVRLVHGTGNFVVNGIAMPDYFKHKRLEPVVWEPLKLVQMEAKFDVKVRVEGGGISGQAEAVRHGVARALLSYDEAYKKQLRDAGLLTRDPRMVERKKFGQAGARKRFQFSKR